MNMGLWRTMKRFDEGHARWIALRDENKRVERCRMIVSDER